MHQLPFALAFLTSLALSQQPLALVGATVHIGDGSPPLADAVVLVRDCHIVAVGAAGTPVPADAQRIDLTGKHLTPGLVDTHVHYSQTGWADGRPDAADVRKEHPYEQAMADNAAFPERFHLAFLHAGVTAVFDVGGYPWTLAPFDPQLSLPDQQQFAFPKTADEARAVVKAHQAAGSAAIKFWYVTRADSEVATWTAVLHAIGAAAKQAGLPLVVHATTLATAKDAVSAGAALLVHSVEDRVSTTRSSARQRPRARSTA